MTCALLEWLFSAKLTRLRLINGLFTAVPAALAATTLTLTVRGAAAGFEEEGRTTARKPTSQRSRRTR